MEPLIEIPGNEQHIGELSNSVLAAAKRNMEAHRMGNAVEIQAPSQTAVAPAVNDSAAVIHMIERAALDPNVDIDKMERLLQMQERIMARNAKAAFDAAFADMQKELPVINERGGIKDRNGNVQSKYALWEDINEAIKPILARHGFGISFRTGKRDGHIVVTGVLAHREGHREETEMELPADTSGSKNAVQAVGSSTSYGKRYTAGALLNLTSRGEDDDGHAAGVANVQVINEEQFLALNQLIEEADLDKVAFCEHWRIDSVKELPAGKFNDAVASLRRRIAYRAQQSAVRSANA
ncbi:ERF family protein [Gellertiella hungarica]|uniref:ERF superfamily protein n=1 Tax=Gellertiella hungarica TaxID=1572859 RepID=A0A7W6J2M9_9HYPH|nr:ERF family protein [Gellertiella hungarica]MBB4063641.1 hypothetical protein [Gellertiella hungarica]